MFLQLWPNFTIMLFPFFQVLHTITVQQEEQRPLLRPLPMIDTDNLQWEHEHLLLWRLYNTQ